MRTKGGGDMSWWSVLRFMRKARWRPGPRPGSCVKLGSILVYTCEKIRPRTKPVSVLVLVCGAAHPLLALRGTFSRTRLRV